jgi:hypothetical protein
MAKQLIIVSRDEPGLYHALREDWATDENVTVVLDRRLGQRRRQPVTTELERRRGERRVYAAAAVLLTWKGGGATARRADIVAALGASSGSIAVRQKPGAKADSRASARGAEDGRQPTITRQPTMGAPTHAVIALVILLGTLSGGVFAGLALWLLLSYEFPSASARPLRSASSPLSRSASTGSRLRAWLPLSKARRA